MGERKENNMENNVKIWQSIENYSFGAISKKYLKKCKPEQALENQSKDIQKYLGSNNRGIAALLGDTFVKELEKAAKSDEARLIYGAGYTIDIATLIKDIQTGIEELVRLPFTEIAEKLREQQRQADNLTTLLNSFLLYNRTLSRTDAIKKMKTLSKKSHDNQKDEMAYLYTALADQLQKSSDSQYEETKRVVLAANKE